MDQGDLIETGSFRVDRRKALAKLAAFRMEDRSLFILPFVRAAVGAAATGVEVEAGAGEARIAFDGRPFQAEDLKDPYACLLSAEEGGGWRRRDLAIGLLSAFGAGASSVEVDSGAGPDRFRLAASSPNAETLVPAADEGAGTVIRICFGRGNRGLVRRAQAQLAEHCTLSPIPIWSGDAELPRSRRPPEGGLYFERDGLYGWLSPMDEEDRPSGIGISVRGVLAGWHFLPLPLAQVWGRLNGDHLTLNASQSGLAQDEAFSAAMAVVAEQAERLLLQGAESYARRRPLIEFMASERARAPGWAWTARLARWLDRELPSWRRRLAGARAAVLGGDPRRDDKLREGEERDRRLLRWLGRARDALLVAEPPRPELLAALKGALGPERECEEASLESWLERGRRFTESEAAAIGLQAARELEKTSGPGLERLPPRLEAILLSRDFRVRLAGGRGADGGPHDLGLLGDSLQRLLPGRRLSGPLGAVLARLRDPGRRPRRASEAADDLSSALRGRQPGWAALRTWRPYAWAAGAASAAALGWLAYLASIAPDFVLPAREQPVQSLAFGWGGALASSSEGGLELWDSPSWSSRRLAPPASGSAAPRAAALAFSPDGRALAVGFNSAAGTDGSGKVALWSVTGGAWIWQREASGEVRDVVFSPRSDRLAVSANSWRGTDGLPQGTIQLLDAATGSPRAASSAEGRSIQGLGYVDGGRRLLYRSAPWNSEKRFFEGGKLKGLGPDAEGDREVWTANTFDRFSVSPRGRQVVLSGRGDPILRVLDLGKGPGQATIVARLNNDVGSETCRCGPHGAGAFSADGGLFAASLRTEKRLLVRLWRTDTWAPIRSFTVRAPRDADVLALGISPDGRLVAAAVGDASGSDIRIWRTPRR